MATRSARRTHRSGEAAVARPVGYAARSTDPLHILVFLLPLVVFYEAALFLSDHSGVVDTVAAHELINRFLRVFGDAALYLPGLVLIGILIVLKIAKGDSWTVRLPVIPLMIVESAVWAIPLLVIAALLSASPAAQPGAGADLHDLPLLSRIALSIGAGLYEELLFRLLFVSVAGMVFRNIFRLSDTWSAGLAIAVASAAFTFYHQPAEPGSLAARRLLYFVAGCFLGLIYVLRGFGIVVGTHATYDLFILVFLQAEHQPD